MATSSSVCRADYPATNLSAAVTKYVGCAWGDVLAHPTVFVPGATCAAVGGVALLAQWSHGRRGRTSACRIAMVSVETLCMRCVQSLLSDGVVYVLHDILGVLFTNTYWYKYHVLAHLLTLIVVRFEYMYEYEY